MRGHVSCGTTLSAEHWGVGCRAAGGGRTAGGAMTGALAAGRGFPRDTGTAGHDRIRREPSRGSGFIFGAFYHDPCMSRRLRGKGCIVHYKPAKRQRRGASPVWKTPKPAVILIAPLGIAIAVCFPSSEQSKRLSYAASILSGRIAEAGNYGGQFERPEQ